MTGTRARDWRIVAAAGFGMSLGMPAIILYTVGVFFDPLAHDVGLTRAQFGAGLLATTIALAFSVPLVGMAVDRFGVRPPVLFGAVLLASSLGILALTAASPLGYIVAMALAGVLGAGASPVGYTRAVTATFDRARGTAMGVTLTLVGLGTVVLPQLAGLAIEAFGWRGGFVCLGMMALLTIPVNYFWLGSPRAQLDGPATVERGDDGDPTRGMPFLRDLVFWLMLIGFTAVATAMFGFMVHLVPFARSSGANLVEATRYASLLGFSGLVSRVIIGALCDVVPAQRVMFGCVMLASIAMAMVARDTGLTALTAIALGFVVGAEVDLMSILASRYYTGRMYGRVYGTLYAPTIIGTGLSSLWIGAMADQHGYALPLYLGAAFGALGGALFLFLPQPVVQPRSITI